MAELTWAIVAATAVWIAAGLLGALIVCRTYTWRLRDTHYVAKEPSDGLIATTVILGVIGLLAALCYLADES